MFGLICTPNQIFYHFSKSISCQSHNQILYVVYGYFNTYNFLNYYLSLLFSYHQGRREVRGALKQNIFKITAFEKIVANLI